MVHKSLKFHSISRKQEVGITAKTQKFEASTHLLMQFLSGFFSPFRNIGDAHSTKLLIVLVCHLRYDKKSIGNALHEAFLIISSKDKHEYDHMDGSTHNTATPMIIVPRPIVQKVSGVCPCMFPLCIRL